MHQIIIVLLAAGTRLLPHPPNFTPLGAMALFGGSRLRTWKAFFIPLGALFISDIFIGFYNWHIMLAVYGSFAIGAMLGKLIRPKTKIYKTAGIIFINSLVFFVISNFAVWQYGALYRHNIDGLIKCYLAALPFWRNSLMGDAFYAIMLFGAEALANKYILKKGAIYARNTI